MFWQACDLVHKPWFVVVRINCEETQAHVGPFSLSFACVFGHNRKPLQTTNRTFQFPPLTLKGGGKGREAHKSKACGCLFLSQQTMVYYVKNSEYSSKSWDFSHIEFNDIFSTFLYGPSSKEIRVVHIVSPLHLYSHKACEVGEVERLHGSLWTWIFLF